MSNHSVKCKFCGLPFTVNVDEDSCGWFKLPWWLSLAACNRCADYRTRMLDYCDSIKRTCDDWTQACNTGPKTEAKARQDTDEILCAVTKRLYRFIDKHCRATTQWDHAIVETLMDKPQHARSVILGYAQHVERESRKAHAQPATQATAP